MKFAVFSDVHNNLEAFNTMLDDMFAQNVEKSFCLGDLLGYGPKPIECIDLMMKLCKEGKVEVCLQGNHDFAAIWEPERFNEIAEEAIYWTRETIDNASDKKKSSQRWDFISGCPSKYCYADSFLFVHGSPIKHQTEYVFPEDVDDKGKMAAFFKVVPKYCFMGHTHIPGVFIDETKNGDYKYLADKEVVEQFQGRYPLGEQKLMINVGSVGQPRDLNPDSCYVVVQYEEGSSDNYVEFRRVRYDFSKTQKEIKNIERFAGYKFLWERLEKGR